MTKTQETFDSNFDTEKGSIIKVQATETPLKGYKDFRFVYFWYNGMYSVSEYYTGRAVGFGSTLQKAKTAARKAIALYCGDPGTKKNKKALQEYIDKAPVINEDKNEVIYGGF